MPSHPRVIPSIEQLRQRAAVRRIEARYGRDATVQALRAEAAALRERLAASTVEVRDAAEAAERIEAGLEARLGAALSPSLQPVINASGVIVHTNLGRAPLGPAAIARIAAVASGYANLEYDLPGGRRGSRTAHASRLLTRLTGAESAVVVNNNAAAVLLALAALAAGREVVISRGELVEIGGGFRVPDVLRQSGAILREVGTTNRTRAADYATAIEDRTAMLLRVHPSNFRIEGFTERPALAELVELGRRFDLPVVEDLGSGHLDELAGIEEPTVRESIAAGVAVCTFSGDKLLGGPQAGVIAGRRAELDRMRSHPLMRALRVDKLTYAALEATLIEHATGRAGDSRAGGAHDRDAGRRSRGARRRVAGAARGPSGAHRLGRRDRGDHRRREHPRAHAAEPGARRRGRRPVGHRARRGAAFRGPAGRRPHRRRPSAAGSAHGGPARGRPPGGIRRQRGPRAEPCLTTERLPCRARECDAQGPTGASVLRTERRGHASQRNDRPSASTTSGPPHEPRRQGYLNSSPTAMTSMTPAIIPAVSRNRPIPFHCSAGPLV